MLRKTGKHIITSITFLLLLYLSTNAQDTKFEAAVSKTTVAAGENFRYELSLNAGQGRSFQPPDFGGLNVLQGPSTSSRTQIINGRMSREFSLTYILRAPKEGTYTIGQASIISDGKRVKSQPVKVTATKAQKNPQQQDAIQKIKDNLFIRAIIDKSEPFVGEQVTVTFKLYTAVDIDDYGNLELPQLQGYWMQPLKTPNQLKVEEENYKGKRYKTALLRQYALFPQRSGELTVEPTSMDFIVRVPKKQSRRRSRDPFYDFFNDPFFGGSYERKKLNIESRVIKLNVQELPPNAPPSFNGAVGEFEFSASTDKTETETNDPISLKLKVGGVGNIKLIQTPEVDIPEDFESYDPKMQENIAAKTTYVRGSKTFEYLLIPRQPGEYTIDPVEFSFFDPDKEKYVTLRSDTFNFKITGEASTGAYSSSKKAVESLNKDIRYIQTKSPDWDSDKFRFWGSWLFWLFLFLPFPLTLAAGWFMKRSDYFAANEGLNRKRKAAKEAKKRLKSARQAKENSKEEDFYRALDEALWNYASDRFGIERAKLSKDEIEQSMLKKNVEDNSVKTFLSLTEKADLHRYAPSAIQEPMGEIYDNAEKLINNIENQLKG